MLGFTGIFLHVVCVLINFFCCLCLLTYPSKALNFLAALQFYFFYVCVVNQDQFKIAIIST